MNKTLLLLAALMAVVTFTPRTLANETDQFTLPAGEEFADLGDFFSGNLYLTLTELRDATNKKIQAALEENDGDELERLHSAEYIAGQVAKEYGLGFVEASSLEKTLKSDEARARYAGKVIAYAPSRSIYSFAHLPIDPRNAFLVAKNSTVKVYGIYFGLDKIGHFHQIGYSYFKRAMNDGSDTQEEAAQGAIRAYSKGILSEGGLIGNIAAGVYSNADLAANYIGMKFYFNLTQRVRLHGKIQQPLLVRDGEYWRLNDYVKPDAPIFKPFVSEHFNEALNPCVYSADMRGNIERRLRRDADNILAFYCDEQGDIRPRSYFDQKVEELWTYYGEEYGHSRGSNNLVTIGDACYDGNTPLVSAERLRPRTAAADAKVYRGIR
ncbi:MAG: hypothetical protein IT444_07300 [Phycisphaeraceae bacterium]|nr:hypothetical protein [Phycisphaeraceae bacterium]